MSLDATHFIRQRLSKGRSHYHHGWLARFHIDLPLLLSFFLLMGYTSIILYSASNQNISVVYRQLIHYGIAFSILFFLAQIPPRFYQYWAPYLFGLGIILLIGVLLFGEISKGAQRWLSIGGIRFQPSELMKVATPMMLAWYLSRHTLPPRFSQLILSALILAVPVGLIAKQPDLGTALLIGSSGTLALFLGGISWRFIMLLLTSIALLAPVAWMFMYDYQKQRVLTFLDPERDPLGQGWNIIQSKIAIGSGGVYGKGWLNGTQSHLHFLPERTTDFIFAVCSEEFGFLGVLLLILIYLFIVIRGLHISIQAQDSFTRLLASTLVLTFFVYVFVNIGMVTGLLPVVGVPLPLVSYGGTSVVTLLAGFGIIMSIETHRKLVSK